MILYEFILINMLLMNNDFLDEIERIIFDQKYFYYYSTQIIRFRVNENE